MILAQYRPTEQDVQRVMQETGMQQLQAYRHVQQRMQVQQQREPYPLGKSQHFA